MNPADAAGGVTSGMQIIIFIAIAIAIVAYLYLHNKKVHDKLDSLIKKDPPPPPAPPVDANQAIRDLQAQLAEAHRVAMAAALAVPPPGYVPAPTTPAPTPTPAPAPPPAVSWDPYARIDAGNTGTLYADWQALGRPVKTVRGDDVDTAGWPLVNGFRYAAPAANLVDHKDDPAYDWDLPSSQRRFAAPAGQWAQKTLTVPDGYTGPITLEISQTTGNAANFARLSVARDGAAQPLTGAMPGDQVPTSSATPRFSATPGTYVISMSAEVPLAVLVNFRKQ